MLKGVRTDTSQDRNVQDTRVEYEVLRTLLANMEPERRRVLDGVLSGELVERTPAWTAAEKHAKMYQQVKAEVRQLAHELVGLCCQGQELPN